MTNHHDVSTICNECNLRTVHPTLARAFRSFRAHRLETGHDDLMYKHTNGWQRHHLQEHQ